MDTEMVQIPRKALEKIEWINVACGEGYLSICPACGREKEMQKGHKDDCPIGIALNKTSIEQKTMELDGDKFVTQTDKPAEQKTMKLDGIKFVTQIGEKNGKGSSCKGCHFIKKDEICGLPDVGIPEVAIEGCNPINWDDGKNRVWVKAEEKEEKIWKKSGKIS
jgi:hypothetical protein